MTKKKETAIQDNTKDSLERRCPRLGGSVTFNYCRTHAGESLPCWKVFECWWEIFDINGYLQQQLSEEHYQALVDMKPKPKILSLVELIAQTQKNLSEEK